MNSLLNIGSSLEHPTSVRMITDLNVDVSLCPTLLTDRILLKLS